MLETCAALHGALLRLKLPSQIFNIEVHEAPALEGALSAGSQQAEEIAQRGGELAALQHAPLHGWERPAAQGPGEGRLLGARAVVEQSAETAAAAPEVLAAQLAAVASGLSQEQLKTLFLAVLTGSPPAAPQHGAPRERQAGSSSALAQIPEDDVGSAFWIGEVDSRSQPADGRTQLVLVAGPYPDLTDALNSIPADRQVGVWQFAQLPHDIFEYAHAARAQLDVTLQVERITVLLPQSSQVWLMPGSSSQVIVRAGHDVPASSSGQQSVGVFGSGQLLTQCREASIYSDFPTLGLQHGRSELLLVLQELVHLRICGWAAARRLIRLQPQ